MKLTLAVALAATLLVGVADGASAAVGSLDGASAYPLGRNVSVGARFVQDKDWAAQLYYRGARPEAEGTWGLYAAYRYQDRYVLVNPVWGSAGSRQQGWELGASYAPLKNVVLSAHYFNGTDLGSGEDAERVLGRIEFYF